MLNFQFESKEKNVKRNKSCVLSLFQNEPSGKL